MTKQSEESTNQVSQGVLQPHANTDQHSNDHINEPNEYDKVDQQLTSARRTIPGTIQSQTNVDEQDYEVVDKQDRENGEQMNSEYATIQDVEKPYDLPLTGHMGPTTTGEYSQLTHTYENPTYENH